MLSVIVPAYQAEAHLPGLFQSLDAAPDWEAIIVDDGSTDGTAEIAQEWLGRRGRGQLIRLEHSTPGHARQVGLEAAQGDYVTYADADDRVVTSVLGGAPSCLEEFSADVFVADYSSTSDHCEFSLDLGNRGRIRRAASRRVLTSRAAVWGKVYRRSFLVERAIKFPSLRSADDVFFSWRLAAARPQVIETKDVGYLYWVAPHGQLTRDPRYFWDGLDSLALVRTEGRSSDLHGLALSEYAYWSGVMHILRKSEGQRRPSIARMALRNFLGSRTGTSS